MSKQAKKIVTILIALIIVLFIGFALFGSNSVNVMRSEVSLPETPTASLGRNKIVFSNGRSFVSYDYQTKASTPISPDVSKLPEIRSLSVSKNHEYLLFSTATQASDDMLGSKLASEGNDLNLPYWWIYDLDKKTFRHLGPGVLVARWDPKNPNMLHAMRRGSEANDISTYTLPGLAQTGSTFVDSYTNFIPLNGGYLVESTKSDIYKITQGSGEKSRIFEGMGGLDPSPNGSYSYVVNKSQNAGNSHVTSIIDLESLKVSELAELEENLVVWDENSMLYFEDGGKIQKYNPSTGKAIALNIKGLAEGAPRLEPLVALADNTLLSRAGLKSYIIGKEIPEQYVLKQKEYTKTLPDNSLIEYYEEEGAFIVSIEGVLTSERRSAIYDSLKKDGVDPYMQELRFSELAQSFGGSHP